MLLHCEKKNQAMFSLVRYNCLDALALVLTTECLRIERGSWERQFSIFAHLVSIWVKSSLIITAMLKCHFLTKRLTKCGLLDTLSVILRIWQADDGICSWKHVCPPIRSVPASHFSMFFSTDTESCGHMALMSALRFGVCLLWKCTDLFHAVNSYDWIVCNSNMNLINASKTYIKYV